MSTRLAELGLDIRQIRASLEEIARGFDRRVGPAADRAGSSIGRFAKAMFGLVAAQRALNAAVNQADRMSDAQNKYEEGSDKLREQQLGTDKESRAQSRVLSSQLSNFKSQVENVIGSIIAASVTGWNMAINAATGDDKGAKELEDKLQAARMYDAVDKDIARREEAIADYQQKGLTTKTESITLMGMEKALAEQQLRLAQNILVSDAKLANAAKERIGALEASLAIADRERKVEMRRAEATTKSMQLEDNGMKNIAERVKIEADYYERILKAKRDGGELDREGENSLSRQLKIQKNIALSRNDAKEFNLTSKDRRDERTAARKLARDLRKSTQRDAGLARRAADMTPGQNATPGSMLDRYIQRQGAKTPEAIAAEGQLKEVKITGQVAADIATIKDKVSSPPNH